MTNGSRLKGYERRSTPVLLALACVFLVVYAVPILRPELPALFQAALAAISGVLWLAFAADLAIRVYLAEDRLRYLLQHPVDVLLVVVPMLRPLRVLRVFTAGQALVAGGGRAGAFRATQAVVIGVGLLVLVGALAVLDAERTSPDANITSFADAVWWGVTTVTTVGYGDRYPVTGAGRIVAATLMVVGIALVGVVTASVAAWFIRQTKNALDEEITSVETRLDQLSTQMARLHQEICELREAVTSDCRPEPKSAPFDR